MPAFATGAGEPIHCVELTTDNKLTGTFKFDQDGIHTQIYNYEDFFFIKPEEPIVLLTGKNITVSLHHNIGGPPGSHSRVGEPARTIYRQDITSNIAVFGHDGSRQG